MAVELNNVILELLPCHPQPGTSPHLKKNHVLGKQASLDAPIPYELSPCPFPCPVPMRAEFSRPPRPAPCLPCPPCPPEPRLAAISRRAARRFAPPIPPCARALPALVSPLLPLAWHPGPPCAVHVPLGTFLVHRSPFTVYLQRGQTTSEGYLLSALFALHRREERSTNVKHASSTERGKRCEGRHAVRAER